VPAAIGATAQNKSQAGDNPARLRRESQDVLREAAHLAEKAALFIIV